ncbi:MAG: hypothetical protein HRF48_15575, partial [Chloroflexota bacterium]
PSSRPRPRKRPRPSCSKTTVPAPATDYAAGTVVLLQDGRGRFLGRGRLLGDRLRNLLPRRITGAP